MISKAKSCPGGTALFNYVVNEAKGYELLRNDISGITPKEMYSDMKVFQQQNLRCVNNTISMVLSPTIADGKRMTNEDLKALTQDFLKAMDIDPKSHQFIAFVHDEKDHKHIHILLNRVQKDGKLIKDSFISKKAQTAAHETAKMHNLTSAKDIRNQNEAKSKLAHTNIKKEIKSSHFKALSYRPKNLKEYQNQMSKMGIQVLATINKQGKVQGFRFLHEESGVNLKASEVDGNLKMNELFKNEELDYHKATHAPEQIQDMKINTDKLASILTGLSIAITPDVDDELPKKKKSFRR